MRKDRKDLWVNMRKNYNFSKSVPSLSRVFGLLREQEEDKDKGDDSADDLFDAEDDKEDDASKGKGDDSDDDATESDDAEDEKGDEEKDDKKEDEGKPKLSISAEDKARLEDSIDDELEGVMQDYEQEARKSAALKAEKMKTESLRRVYHGILYEVAADDIDLQQFANDLARLVKNYDSLLDIKSIILNKAYGYIQNNYGDDTVKALKDVLEQELGIEVERGAADKDQEPEIPIAVGASGGSSSGGGVGGA